MGLLNRDEKDQKAVEIVVFGFLIIEVIRFRHTIINKFLSDQISLPHGFVVVLCE